MSVTLPAIARTYAQHLINGENAEARLIDHPEFPTFLEIAWTDGKVNGFVSHMAAARALFGIPSDAPGVKVGPRGEQVWTIYREAGDGAPAITGQHVQKVANLFSRLAGKKSPEAGVIRVSLSGEGGGTVTLKPGHADYARALEFFQSLQG